MAHICLKYFMAPTKTLLPSSYTLNVRSLKVKIVNSLYNKKTKSREQEKWVICYFSCKQPQKNCGKIHISVQTMQFFSTRKTSATISVSANAQLVLILRKKSLPCIFRRYCRLVLLHLLTCGTQLLFIALQFCIIRRTVIQWTRCSGFGCIATGILKTLRVQ